MSTHALLRNASGRPALAKNLAKRGGVGSVVD